MLYFRTNILSGALALWICGAFATVLFIIRLGLRKWRRQPFTIGDGWIAVALLFNGLRMAGLYYVNQYNDDFIYAILQTETALITTELRDNLVLTGSFMVPTRVAVVVVLWSLKLATLDFVRILLRKLRHEDLIVNSMYAVLALTFAASFIAIFFECRPLSLFWTLSPIAQQCYLSTLWITIYEASNVVTNLLLLLIPFPLILRAKIPSWKRARLLLLFSVGICLIATNIFCLIQGLTTFDMRTNRVVWNSIEVGVGALVATLPSIYVLVRPTFKRLDEETTRRKSCTPDALHPEGRPSLQRKPNARKWDSMGLTETSTEPSEKHHSLHRITTQSLARSSVPPPSPASLPAGSHVDEKPPSLHTASIRNSIWSTSRDGTRQASIFNPSMLSSRSSFRETLHNSFRTSQPLPPPPSPTRSPVRFQDCLAAWLEAEENESGALSLAQNAFLEDANVAGIFVATEINQEVIEIGQRPRIITIPPRSPRTPRSSKAPRSPRGDDMPPLP
ncbi:hypothetical protein F5Y18DRAFT_443506 [Xylariaceae sp. FL1019]|nr:hypothetical protein F5Y18DRAFT_443506 [Xylariaceae sp. FL1019]